MGATRNVDLNIGNDYLPWIKIDLNQNNKHRDRRTTGDTGKGKNQFQPRVPRVPRGLFLCTKVACSDLERHSQRELEDARVARGGDSTEGGRRAIAVGQTQVDVVQSVEDFEPELEFEALADRKIFMQSQIECG